MVPSTLTLRTSVNGVVTVPIRIWKVSDAEPPAPIVTVCPKVAVSTAGIPPNQAQLFPANGGAEPPPVPQLATSHSGVPKFVEVCVVQPGHGLPASKVPSTITFGPPHGVPEADGEGVAEGATVAV